MRAAATCTDGVATPEQLAEVSARLDSPALAPLISDMRFEDRLRPRHAPMDRVLWRVAPLNFGDSVLERDCLALRPGCQVRGDQSVQDRTLVTIDRVQGAEKVSFLGLEPGAIERAFAG